MCGRYAATKDPATLVEEFAAADETRGDAPPPDHNVAPTKDVVTVVRRRPRDSDVPAVRTLRVMRWGLVPFWAKGPAVGSKMINTRSETVLEKPAFRKALARRRCLVPADGWYEWRRQGKERDAFYLTGPDSSSLALAGIWECWRKPEAAATESPLITFSVLTTDSVGQLVDIHHRMPLLLPKQRWAEWLDPDSEDVSSLLVPPSLEIVDTLEVRPVSDRVNNVRENGPGLIERVEATRELDDGALFQLPKA